MLKNTRLLFLLASLFVSSIAFAARPMMTDDARIIDPQSCQLESWTKNNKKWAEYWALPACNPLGFFELTVGGSKAHSDDSTLSSDRIIQAKTIFKELQPNDWSIGLALGRAEHLGTIENPSSHDIYGYVPMTWSFNDDQQFLHINLGASKKQLGDVFRRTWGIGTEIEVAANTYLVAETYGEDALKPSYQIGVRRWLLPNKFQVDVTTGTKSSYNTQNRWFSLGIRLLLGN